MEKEISDILRFEYDLAAGTIESEGLGYAIQHYLDTDTEDEELNEAVKQARIHMNKIVDILEPYLI